jgi:hypothetical protein
MSKRNKSGDILGVKLNDLRFTSNNIQTFVPILITPNELPKNRGHPIDNSTLAKLKAAVLAESWITIEILCNLDIRAMTNQRSEHKISIFDDRNSKERRLDAEIIVSDIHKKWRNIFQDKFIFKIGYEISKILRYGEAEARRHLNITDSRELKHHLRRVKPNASKLALPDADDLTLAQNEIQKIRALLIGQAKCQEFIQVYEFFSANRTKKRGRKPNNFTPDLDIIIDRKYISRIDRPTFNDLLMISAHGDINPTTLWHNIDCYFDTLEFQRLIGKDVRRQLLSDDEILFMEETISAVSARNESFDTPMEKYLREMVTGYLAKFYEH